ncbi:hypothetical protein AB0C34_16785 [Nocardia sp. NPDC049220]
MDKFETTRDEAPAQSSSDQPVTIKIRHLDKKETTGSSSLSGD